MIFVILGTQDKPFTRLLKMLEEADIDEKIIVQAGYTSFSSEKMEVRDYIPKPEFSKLIEEADLVIAHGGVGTIMECLKKGKKLLVVPRLSKYGEHQNDHQLEITETFAEKGYLIPVYEGDDIKEKIEEAENFTFAHYESTSHSFAEKLSTYLGL